MHKRIPNSVDCLTDAEAQIPNNCGQKRPCGNKFIIKSKKDLPLYYYGGINYSLFQSEFDVNVNDFELKIQNQYYKIISENCYLSTDQNFNLILDHDTYGITSNLSMTYLVYLYIKQPNHSVGNCENIVLDKSGLVFNDETVGIESDVIFEYTTNISDPSSFKELPWDMYKYYDQNIGEYVKGKFSFKANDLVGQLNYSGNIYFRFKHKVREYNPNLFPIGPFTERYSNIVFYEIKSCSPKVLSQTPEANKCYGESLGKV
ncbi:hypothetical protein, partial [Flavobacterium oreochromis]|uniref:hypothetical protein n=1 Tax=Flavobacterium oreochromis TaxID=2906078 RepID=UPI00385AFC92